MGDRRRDGHGDPRDRPYEAGYRGDAVHGWPTALQGHNASHPTQPPPPPPPQIIEGDPPRVPQCGRPTSETNRSTLTRLTPRLHCRAQLQLTRGLPPGPQGRRRFTPPRSPATRRSQSGPRPDRVDLTDVNDPGARNVLLRPAAAATSKLPRPGRRGVDLIIIETIFCSLNAKAAVFAVRERCSSDRDRRWSVTSRHHHHASGRTLSRSGHRGVLERTRKSQARKPDLRRPHGALGRAEDEGPYIAEVARGSRTPSSPATRTPACPNAFANTTSPRSGRPLHAEFARADWSIWSVADAERRAGPEIAEIARSAMAGARELPETLVATRLSGWSRCTPRVSCS